MNDKWVIVGRFGRPHGIKGMISVISFTEPRDNIITYQQHWHIQLNQQWKPVTLVALTTHHKSILAQVSGYEEREAVTRLTNCEIAIPVEQLPQLEIGEYYWHQLIALKVFTVEGEALGNVVEILPTGMNDILVISGEKQYLIPYLPGRFVKEVNLAQGIIVVDWDMDSN